MKSRPGIHLTDAAQATQTAHWADAIGHCAASETAGAARLEIEATLRTAFDEGLRVSAASSPAQRACLLAVQTMASQDAAKLAELTSFLARNADTLPIADLPIADDVATIARRFDRLAAIGLLDGLTEEGSRKQAAGDVIAALEALVAANPSGWDARVRRVQALLDLERFGDAINDLRYLAEIGLPDPFVHTNLITYVRRLSHPEVVAAVGALMAVMPQTSEEFERWRYALIGMNATPQAFALLEKLNPHKPEYAVIKHLRSMADDLDQRPTREFGRSPSGRHLLYASMVCWGAKYLELMDRVSLASLLSPGNFPALCADHDVVLDLFTMAEDVDQILAMPSLQALAAHRQIRLYVFPREIARRRQHFGAFSYQFLGFGSALTIQRAKRDGADLLFLIPDVVYADGSFGYVASIVTKAPRALMADGLNTAADPTLKALEPYRGQRDPSLTISIQDLIDLSAPRFMTRTTNHFFDPEPGQANSYPQRVIFCEGVVIAVCRSPTHSMAKADEPEIELVTGLGVAGDAHNGETVKHRSRVARDPAQPNLRQVHLIHGELIHALRAQGFDLALGRMGENVVTQGVDLLGLPTGAVLRLGKTAEVRITGLRNPCAQLDGVQKGLMAATLDRDAKGNLIRKAGIMGVVLTAGKIRAGDPISVTLPTGARQPLLPV